MVAQRSEPSDELGLQLLRARRGHGGLVLKVRLLPAAALLTAVHLLITGSRLSRSWWWQDDLNILATAAHRSLSPGLLLTDYNGHLIPGSWAIAWVFDRMAPLQWWPAAVLTVIVVAVTDVMMLALLRRLFGDRPAILLPYAMFCSTSLMLTGTLWWAASLQWLPVTLSLVAALWFHVGYLRGHRRSDAVGALVAVLLGLLFFEKALTTPLVLAVFTVLYGVPGALWRRPWLAFRRYRGYWLVHAVLAGGFLWLYLSRVTIETGAASKPRDVLEVARLMIFETLLPSLIGGPLHWITSRGTINAWPGPSAPLAIAAWVLTAVAVIGSLIFVRGAWRAWVLLVIFLGTSIALVVRARLGFIGPFVGRDHRYLTDAAVIAPLCLALAWLPLRGGLDPAEPELGPAEPAPEGSAGQPVGWRRNPRIAGRAWVDRHRGAAAGVAALAVLVMTTGGIVSGETFMNSWTRNPTESYFANLTADLKAHKGPVYLFGDEVPPDLVMVPTFLDDRRIAHITSPLPVRPEIQAAVPYFSVVDSSGHLHDGAIKGYSATIKKGSACGTSSHSATVRLPSTPGAGRWKLRLGYLANRQTTARVSIGGNPPVTMRLERGLHVIFVSLLAGGSAQITLDGVAQGSTVCLGAATLGFPIAKP
jgi:hypothetical protein